ncbi:GNAT family N-acetyltransferase [Streptomyces sp. NPDC045431]|uniref:GNAT family N-acetyltransferase n=1 Tax=Streptomyces sp. NPDC045431 TaxID=3155613 RepID=UPI0033E029F5
MAELRWRFKREDHEERSPTQPPDETEQWIHDRLTDGRWLAWVAESGGEIRGHVFLSLVERLPEPYHDNLPIGYVTNFYVTPSQRNKGAGSALLEALKQHCRSAGFDTLIVWPSERSSTLWRRSGFQPPEELLELPLDA